MIGPRTIPSWPKELGLALKPWLPLQPYCRVAGPLRGSLGLPVSAGRWPLRWARRSDCRCRRRSGRGSSRQRGRSFQPGALVEWPAIDFEIGNYVLVCSRAFFCGCVDAREDVLAGAWVAVSAALMLNPSTCESFCDGVDVIATYVHHLGGLG